MFLPEGQTERDYKKGCPDFRRNSLQGAIRQKSRWVQAQQQAGQSSAQKSAQQRSTEMDFGLLKKCGLSKCVHRDLPVGRLQASFV